MNCETCKNNILCFQEDKENHNVFDEECQFNGYEPKERGQEMRLTEEEFKDNTLFEFEGMYSDYYGEVWRCKKCGDRVILTKDDIKNIKECPNCGAKMISSNSEIEKSKSEIIPDYRDGWRMRGEAE